jgi:hypothetical protein
MWGAHWSIVLERKNIPTVFVVDEPFKTDVQITCDKEGMSHLRRLTVPHPCGDVPEEQLPTLASQLLAALTDSLTEEEESPAAKKIKRLSRLVFEGTLEEMNDFFYRRGWTDGLPIMPPTEDSVEAMLTGTSHPHDETVTEVMLPESLRVTVEKVATVGVMTGCQPAAMPVLLGIIEAFSREVFASTVRSTSSFSFATLVNGPIAKEIGMNAGMNALGSGTENRTNATIGRFLRLAIICLGGGKTGHSDMSSQGNPSKYSFAFAENEVRSPWEPYHVTEGFRPEDSVVSLFSGGWSHSGPFMNADPEPIASAISHYSLPNGVLIIMDPMLAGKWSKEGLTKKDAEERIWGHATKTVAQFRADPFYPPFIEPVLKGRPMYGEQYLWPARYLDLANDESIQVFPRKHVKIVVVGGETNAFAQVWQMSRATPVLVDHWR